MPDPNNTESLLPAQWLNATQGIGDFLALVRRREERK
jgi:hypothetical protein